MIRGNRELESRGYVDRALSDVRHALTAALVEQKRKFSTAADFRRFGTAVARNKVSDFIRQHFHNKRTGASGVVEDWDRLAEQSGKCCEAEYGQLTVDLIAGIETLSEPHKMIIQMRFYGDASWAEIGKVIGKDEKTATAWLDIAADELKLYLDRKGWSNVDWGRIWKNR